MTPARDRAGHQPYADPVRAPAGSAGRRGKHSPAGPVPQNTPSLAAVSAGGPRPVIRPDGGTRASVDAAHAAAGPVLAAITPVALPGHPGERTLSRCVMTRRSSIW